jgi:AraC family transcriptional regulator
MATHDPANMLVVRNMVCARCIAKVEQILDEQLIAWKHVGLGEVELEHTLTAAQRKALDPALAAAGFELVGDRRSRTIARIKAAIVELVHYKGEAKQRVLLSDHLRERLHADPSELNALFVQVEGLTIEQYFIRQRIERAKELLVYDELSLGEIADRLGYSSTAHLSAQFKQVTGITATVFKALRSAGRTPLDRV